MVILLDEKKNWVIGAWCTVFGRVWWLGLEIFGQSYYRQNDSGKTCKNLANKTPVLLRILRLQYLSSLLGFRAFLEH